MKRWIALNKIEFLLTKRQLVYYLLSVGVPTAFYLFFSGMYQETPGGPANFMRDYLISMTAFSMMSTAMFSFPVVLHTDKINNWQKNIAPYSGKYGRILSIKDNRYDGWIIWSHLGCFLSLGTWSEVWICL